jgi:hypothetical protein
MSRPDSITYDGIVYSGCACNCFVKITSHIYDEGDGLIEVQYAQLSTNDFANRARWRSRLKRVWAALRNKDWTTGFEFWDEDSALEFSEKFAEAVWNTFPSQSIKETDVD